MTSGDYDSLFPFGPALVMAGMLLCVSLSQKGIARRTLVGIGLGVAAATGATFGVGYEMYEGREVGGDYYTKSVDVFVDTMDPAQAIRLTLAGLASFTLLFYLGYRLAR